VAEGVFRGSDDEGGGTAARRPFVRGRRSEPADPGVSSVPRVAATWRTLLRGSICFFRVAGVQIVRYRFLESATTHRSSDLRRLGFFHRKGRRNSLLVKLEDPTLHEMANDATNWSYTLGDGEGSF
jgi:hypothetical protein